MNLRRRVLLSLALLLTLTVGAAWLIAAGGVLRPLLGRLMRERVDVALYVVREAEQADEPRARVKALSEELGVDVIVGPPPPPAAVRKVLPATAGRREALLLRGQGSPVAVAVERPGPPLYMIIQFPADLERAPRKIALGLLLLATASTVVGAVVVRQAFQPLELATSAMRRIADGDLRHRVPAGGPVAEVGQTFNQMADRVQTLVQGQRDLMAAVSHELRTPLSRMRLRLDLLRDEQPGAAGRVAALEADVAEVDGLVEELLESARLHQGQLALQRVPTELEGLLAEALAEVDLGARELDFAVTPPGLDAVVDPRRLKRVAVNLLTNVARYTPPEARVWLRAGADGEAGLWISVADDGPGVPADALPRLFDPFFRAEGSRSKATGGLGLGLMLVRQIADAHGGRVEAQPRAGGGLEVRLWLPRRPG